MNELHLFAGTGGGILGGMLLGHSTVCAVEIEPYCRKVLLQRQRDGILPRFPIWDDVRTFNGRDWRGKVDIICGGFPCQDISCANSNAKGIDGERSGLWSEMARIISEVRPRYVFVENSPMLASRGLTRVLGDLTEIGYDAQWCVMGADDVGAPHRRKRMWILAHARHVEWWHCLGRGFVGNGDGRLHSPKWSADSVETSRPSTPSEIIPNTESKRTRCDHGGIWSRSCRIDRGKDAENASMEDTNPLRLQESWPEFSPTGIIGTSENLSNSELHRNGWREQFSQGEQKKGNSSDVIYDSESDRHGVCRESREVSQKDGRQNRELLSEFVDASRIYDVSNAKVSRFSSSNSGSAQEQSWGGYSRAIPQWWQSDPADEDGAFESQLGRVVNGLANRVDRLKAIGNGQVPLVVANAFKLLMSKIEKEYK